MNRNNFYDNKRNRFAKEVGFNYKRDNNNYNRYVNINSSHKEEDSYSRTLRVYEDDWNDANPFLNRNEVNLGGKRTYGQQTYE
jgi:hypothetical protein